MRVLLVSENRCRENLVPYPLGISCVAAATARAGHEVQGLDLMFSTPDHRVFREGVVSPGQDLLEPAFYVSRDVEPWLYDYVVDACRAREGWSI